jgi:hypothetical protein
MKKLLLSPNTFIALCSAFFIYACIQAPAAAPPQWQYKVVYVAAPKPSSDQPTSIKVDEAAMASAGGEGWELASSYVEYNTVFPNFSQDQKIVTGIESNVRPTQLVLLFKKPLTK